jgi:hypothetical protein
MAAVHLARGRVAIDVDVSMSQTLIREALAMFEKMGATPMQRRAQALLTTLGDSA